MFPFVASSTSGAASNIISVRAVTGVDLRYVDCIANESVLLLPRETAWKGLKFPQVIYHSMATSQSSHLRLTSSCLDFYHLPTSCLLLFLISTWSIQ